MNVYIVGGACLSIAISCTLYFASLEGVNKKTKNTLSLIAFLLGLLLIVVGFTRSNTDDIEKEAERDQKELDKKYASLRDSIQPEKPFAVKDQVRINFGSNSAIVSVKNLTEGVDVIKYTPYHSLPLIVYLLNDSLYISTKIFENNKIVVELDRNNFTINQNNYFKRNYNKTSVEVIDQEDHVCLYAEYVKSDEINIEGIFDDTIDSTYYIIGESTYPISYKDEARRGLLIVDHQTVEQDYKIEAAKIPQHFSYTGKEYLGRRLP